MEKADLERLNENGFCTVETKTTRPLPVASPQATPEEGGSPVPDSGEPAGPAPATVVEPPKAEEVPRRGKGKLFETHEQAGV